MRITKLFKRRHKKHKTPEQLQAKRRVISVLLFLCVVLLSVCGFLKFSVLNTSQIVAQFVDSTYINALKDDALLYAQDKCVQSGIPTTAVDENITYKVIFNIENSYISNVFSTSQQFNSEAFEANIALLKDNLVVSTTQMLKQDGINLTNQLNNDINIFATDIAQYVQDKVVFGSFSDISPVLNFANDALVVICGVLAIIILVLMLILFFTGHKKYRNLRYAYYSFSGAALVDMSMVISAIIIKAAKPLTVYPSYVNAALSDYITDCMQDMALIALGVFLLSILTVTFVWQLKRDKI